MDRRTGETIDNFQSALQSVEIILSTQIGSVCMLREFGAGAIELLGRLITPQLFMRFQALVATAVDLWEPRFLVRRVVVSGTSTEIQQGHLGFALEVDYRPRAISGDFTVEGIRQFGLSFGHAGVFTNGLT